MCQPIPKTFSLIISFALHSETAAVAAARVYKATRGDYINDYATEAGAFVKLGFSGTDPSSTALNIRSNPKNVAAPDRFKWRWLGVHDTLQ